MLDMWERQHDMPPEDGDWREWRNSIEARIFQLTQEGVLVKPHQKKNNELSEVIPVEQSQMLEVVPVKPIEISEVIPIKLHQASNVIQDKLKVTPVDQVNQINQVNQEEFKKAFDLLERGDIYVDLFALRRRLGWPRDVFDTMLRSLRDAGTIQLHAGDATTMTPDEIADGFVDENGFRMGSVTWEGAQTPAKPKPEPSAPVEPVEPQAKRRGRPPKKPETVPAPMPEPSATEDLPKRKPGRPPKTH
jgi:hypothetical protein